LFEQRKAAMAKKQREIRKQKERKKEKEKKIKMEKEGNKLKLQKGNLNDSQKKLFDKSGNTPNSFSHLNEYKDVNHDDFASLNDNAEEPIIKTTLDNSETTKNIEDLTVKNTLDKHKENVVGKTKEQTVKTKKKGKKENRKKEKEKKNDKTDSEEEKVEVKVGKEEEEKMNNQELTMNERNQILIKLSELSSPGLNQHDLIDATLMSCIKHPVDFSVDASNEEQINVAKRVWNEANSKTRSLFLKSPSNQFISIAKNVKLVKIISDALDKFNPRVANDNLKKRLDWLEICSKYQEAKDKQSKITPFSTPMSKGELRLIEKYEAKLGEPRPQYEKHYPNQSAVTYPYLLAKLIHSAKLTEMFPNKSNPPDEIKEFVKRAKTVILDLLNFIAVHGSKSNANFTKAIQSFETIPGPRSQLDLKEMLQGIDTDLVSGSNSTVDKHIPNYNLTLKRLIRLIYITTDHKTPWGLMKSANDGTLNNLENMKKFVDDITTMHQAETMLESRDMFSLSCIWYMCIGRQNICGIMVNQYEESASSVMSNILGKPIQGGSFMNPNCTFDIMKRTDEDFVENDFVYENYNSDVGDNENDDDDDEETSSEDDDDEESDSETDEDEVNIVEDDDVESENHDKIGQLPEQGKANRK